MTEWLGCSNCEHLKKDVTCAAYPKGIPIAIASGEVDHLVERPDQVPGILFKARSGVRAAPEQSRFVWEPGDMKPLVSSRLVWEPGDVRVETPATKPSEVEWSDEGYLEALHGSE